MLLQGFDAQWVDESFTAAAVAREESLHFERFRRGRSAQSDEAKNELGGVAAQLAFATLTRTSSPSFARL